MKKLLLSLFVFILFSFIGVYVFLFTPFGNSIAASMLESKANEKGIATFKVEQFELDFKNVKLVSTIDKDSKVTLSGSYDIFSKSFDIKYLVDIKDLSKLEKFTSTKLIGSLVLIGDIKGDEKEAAVTGKTNVFDSDTTYDISLENFEPKVINIDINSAKIEQILSLSNQPLYGKGVANINAKIKDARVPNLSGDVKLSIKEAVLNNTVVNKEFDTKLSKTVHINGEIVSKLIPNKIISNIKVNSSLANINLKHNIVNITDKSINSDYSIIVNKLSDLSDFIETNSNKGFTIDGVVKGDEKLLSTSGQSNIFQSKTQYEINLKDKKPNKINVDINNAQLNEVLAFANQPLYAKGLLNVDAKIKDANIGSLDGTVIASIKKAKLNNLVVNKNFEMKLKKSVNFELDVKSILKKENAVSSVDLNSSLLNLDAKKLDVNLNTLYVNSDYRLKVAKLSNLYDLTNTKLKGALSLYGNIIGDERELLIDGKSDIFSSKSQIDLKLKEYKPSSLQMTLKEVKLEKLLYTIEQPSFAKGVINIDADILNADMENLQGKINTKILKGRLNNKTVNKEFDMKLKKPFDFKGEISTKLKPNNLISIVYLDTTMANLFAKNAIVNLKTNSIKSDYEINAPDLSRLYDVTNTKLRGKVKVNGTILSDKDLLVVGTSNLLGGNLEFTLQNDDLLASVKDIQTKELLHMMYYPLVFDSKAKSDLNYNLKTEKGTLKTLLVDGHILPNQYTNTIKNLTRFDLTREAYKQTVIDSKINKKVIRSTVDMNSKNTEIDVPRSVIDLNKRKIEALVQTRLDDVEFDTKISGSLDDPKVRIQTEKLIESTIKTKAFEEVEEKLIEKLGDDSAKEIIKGLKGLFK